MPCEDYKDALIEVAASGAAPQGELRVHLAECASCRAAFDEEQSLFAAIDSGLHATANAEVPPSLFPHVRARLDEAEVPGRHWLKSLVFASAGVALIFTVFLVAQPHHTGPQQVAKQGAVVGPAPTQSSAGTNPEKVSSEGTQIAAASVGHVQASRNSTAHASATSSNPEVLVPPDEREGLARLVATLNEHRDVAAALLARRPEKKDEAVAVDPLTIPDIEIKPLDGTETETSDGAGEN